MKTIGDKIQARLEKLNINQKELADRVNVTEATISRYLSGARNPRGEILSKIATVLGVTTDYLLGNTDKEYPIDKFEPTLTQKDEKDIEKTLNKTLDMLEKQDGLMLSGELIDDEDFELIKAAIQNGLEYAKKVNKKKYTPKKYRK
ncbi:transcriptional regulator with XRE-family HTH domain [Clostridium beijerinckii]|uniref:helix-turn-helix domain-containing protein n=1 Tax=Clostridium beijerinckii TaxID=1520 RepID=UPI001494B3A7|nr:helix-turn-helix transcriptional regulator [Clostridium beijerinckii]NOW85584.1 transcriptional regulator with XRE-family HTH domain [Clostridium beijerinckii]